MLDQRKSDIWNALGIGPQWIERDELAKAAEEAAKNKAEALAAASPKPQLQNSVPAAASAPSFVNRMQTARGDFTGSAVLHELF